MTIAIDIRVLSRSNRTGVEEYTANLLSHFFEMGSDIKYKLFYNSWHKAHLNENWLNLPNIELKEFKIPNRILSFSAKYFNYPQFDKMLGGADVFFSPHFLVAGLSKKCRRVITFHDLSFERFPEFFSFGKNFFHWSVDPRQQAKDADKIIAVSQSTKDDLVSIYKIPEAKIKVVHSGIGEEFAPVDKNSAKCQEIKRKYGLPDKFILYLGTLEPRKNIAGLIKAFESFKANGGNKEIKLVIAGAKGWLCEDIFKIAESSRFKNDIIFSGFVSSEDKVFLYNLAEVFVYPSFFEGFGFPPLEAMACGVPTITSNCSSLPEIVEDSAILIDPYNFGEIGWAISQVLEDRRLRDLLVGKGIERAKNFSWKKCAKETLEFMV